MVQELHVSQLASNSPNLRKAFSVSLTVAKAHIKTAGMTDLPPVARGLGDFCWNFLSGGRRQWKGLKNKRIGHECAAAATTSFGTKQTTSGTAKASS